MKALDSKGFTEKEALNLTQENKKLKDLAYLKQQKVPGPFTFSNDVQKFMSSCQDSKEKKQVSVLRSYICKREQHVLEENCKCF